MLPSSLNTVFEFVCPVFSQVLLWLRAEVHLNASDGA